MKIDIKHNSFVTFNPKLAWILAKDERVQDKRMDHLMMCSLFISYFAGWIKTNGNKKGFIEKNVLIRRDECGNRLLKEDCEKLDERHFYSIEEELCVGKSTINEVRKSLIKLELLIEQDGYGKQKKFSLNFENVKKLYKAAGDSFEYTFDLTSDTSINSVKQQAEVKSEFEVETKIPANNRDLNSEVDEVETEFRKFEENALQSEQVIYGLKQNNEKSKNEIECDANGIILPANSKDKIRHSEIYRCDEFGNRVNSDEYLQSITNGSMTQISKVFFRIKNDAKTVKSSSFIANQSYKGKAAIQ